MNATAILALSVPIAVIALALQVCGVELARAAIRRWVGLYTVFMLPIDRARRRDELLSDVHEQIRDDRTLGYGAQFIAIRLLVRCVLGVPGDLAWAAPRSTVDAREVVDFYFASLGLVVIMAWSSLWLLASFRGEPVLAAVVVIMMSVGFISFRVNMTSFHARREQRLGHPRDGGGG